VLLVNELSVAATTVHMAFCDRGGELNPACIIPPCSQKAKRIMFLR